MSKKKAQKKGPPKGKKIHAPAADLKVKPEYILPQLHFLCVSMAKVTPDPANARTHNDRNIDSIMKSLAEFKQRTPIVVNQDGTIEKGNGTYEAAKRLGWEYLAAVIVTDNKVTQKAYALTDNRSAELASWDSPLLAEEMRFLQDEGFDLELTGWMESEFKPLLETDWNAPEQEAPTAEEKDPETPPIEVTTTQRAIIEKAVAKVRKEKNKEGLSEGRAVALICAEYVGMNLAKKKAGKKKKIKKKVGKK